jgi:GR25 family glycosyltransferase involved in LPS biosynthesis
MCFFSGLAMHFLSVAPFSVTLILPVAALVTKTSSLQSKAYIMTEKQAHADEKKWALQFDGAFDSFSFVDPVYLQEQDIHDMLANGTIDSNYKSWSVGMDGGPAWNADPKNLSANPKFPRELGCTLAHRSAWKQFLHEHSGGLAAPWAAFFEGDTILQRDFRSRARTLQSKLPTLPAWDVIYMGHCLEECAGSQSPRSVGIGGNVYVRSARQPLCTHSYLLSVRGARQLLKLTMPLKQAVDGSMSAAHKSHKIDSMSVCPPITSQPWQTERYTMGTSDAIFEHISGR